MEFVLVPGAWAGGWIWDEISEYLRKEGHSVHSLTLSGLDGMIEPSEVHLGTHVDDVISTIHARNLKSVVLVGHSYSGIVVGQVASKIHSLISHTIFIESFLPVSGRSLLEVSGLDIKEEKEAIFNNGGLWPAPTREELESQPGLAPEHVALLASKQVGHPGNTVVEPAKLNTSLSEIRATFIASGGWLSSSREAGLVEQLRGSDSWRFHTISGGHWPMLTIPHQLSQLLITSKINV